MTKRNLEFTEEINAKVRPLTELDSMAECVESLKGRAEFASDMDVTTPGLDKRLINTYEEGIKLIEENGHTTGGFGVKRCCAPMKKQKFDNYIKSLKQTMQEDIDLSNQFRASLWDLYDTSLDLWHSEMSNANKSANIQESTRIVFEIVRAVSQLCVYYLGFGEVMIDDHVNYVRTAMKELVTSCNNFNAIAASIAKSPIDYSGLQHAYDGLFN